MSSASSTHEEETAASTERSETGTSGSDEEEEESSEESETNSDEASTSETETSQTTAQNATTAASASELPAEVAEHTLQPGNQESLEQTPEPTSPSSVRSTAVPAEIPQRQRQVGFSEKPTPSELDDELDTIFQTLGVVPGGTLPRGSVLLILRAYGIPLHVEPVRSFTKSASATVTAAFVQELLLQTADRPPLQLRRLSESCAPFTDASGLIPAPSLVQVLAACTNSPRVDRPPTYGEIERTVHTFCDEAGRVSCTYFFEALMAPQQAQIYRALSQALRPDAVEYVNLYRILPSSLRPSPLCALQHEWRYSTGGCAQPRVHGVGLHYSQFGTDVLTGQPIQQSPPEVQIKLTEAVGLPRISNAVRVLRRQVRACLATETRDGLIPMEGSNIHTISIVDSLTSNEEWKFSGKDFGNPFIVRGPCPPETWLYIELSLVVQRNPLRVSSSSSLRPKSGSAPPVHVISCGWTKVPITPLLSAEIKHSTTRRVPLFGGTPFEPEDPSSQDRTTGLRRLGQWIAGQAREAVLTFTVKRTSDKEEASHSRLPQRFLCGAEVGGLIDLYCEAVASLLSGSEKLDCVPASVLHLVPYILNDTDLLHRLLWRAWQAQQAAWPQKQHRDHSFVLLQFQELLHSLWPLLYCVVRSTEGVQHTVLEVNARDTADDALLGKRQLLIDTYLRHKAPLQLTGGIQQLSFAPFSTDEFVLDSHEFP